MRGMRRILVPVWAFGLVLISAAAFGFGADHPLQDPVQEARAHALFKELRCLVCQNQSIEDSGADLAVDLRAVVRELITEGKTDAEILTYMEDRYGQWVLLEPKVSPLTYALWILPWCVGGMALVIAVNVMRRRAQEPQDADARLNEEQKARLKALVDEADQS